MVFAEWLMQREIDNQPCEACGGDRLRPAFDGRTECHAPGPTPVERRNTPKESNRV